MSTLTHAHAPTGPCLTLCGVPCDSVPVILYGVRGSDPRVTCPDCHR